MTSPKNSLFPSEYSTLSIARMLWKSKLLIGAVWFVISVIAAAVALLLPSIYVSEAVILVDSQKIPERYVTSTVNAELQDRIATISQQILSSTRLKKIIEDFDLYHKERQTYFEEEILEMMRRDISVKTEKGWTGNRPGAFRISYQGPTPQVVAQVANRIANLYIEENLKNREIQAEGTSEFLQTQVRNAKQRLDELETTVSDYKMKYNGELPDQEPLLTGTLTRLQTEMEATRDALSRAQQNKVVLENTMRVLEASVAAREFELEHANQPKAAAPAAAKTVTREELLQAQLSALRIRYSDDHPDVKRLREDIERFRQLGPNAEAPSAEPEGQDAPEAAEAAAAPLPEAQPKTPGADPTVSSATEARKALDLSQERLRLAGLKSELQLNAKEITGLTAEQERIRRENATWQKRLNQLPMREREYAEITRDYEISKANYKALLDKALAADMAADLEHRQKSERFTLLDSARVPEKPVKPNRPLILSLGSVLGLVLGVVLGVGKEVRGDLFLGEWELPAAAVVLARLPHIEVTPAKPAKRSLLKSRLALSMALVLFVVLSAAGAWYATQRF